jgi:hypothetical protein
MLKSRTVNSTFSHQYRSLTHPKKFIYIVKVGARFKKNNRTSCE